ncbi:hypothetical protein LA76x_3084 [Lysobacter antibioticus]|uniref:Uncharacterized protein n=1 Tax=Lysobacter antibioticus TaxID=84531 RepID=A0A0S2FCF9_LYSAN|nr:hypothetical protein LA76x_3084 [Lysobacter antibioticus]
MRPRARKHGRSRELGSASSDHGGHENCARVPKATVAPTANGQGRIRHQQTVVCTACDASAPDRIHGRHGPSPLAAAESFRRGGLPRRPLCAPPSV